MLPEILIVLGGPEVSYNAESVLMENPQVDIIVVGEGEVTFSDKVLVTKPRNMIVILDEIPSPFLNRLIELQSSRGVALVETIRGCIYHCSFCLYTKNLTSMRSYSWNRIEEEIQYLSKSKYIHTLYFADPT